MSTDAEERLDLPTSAPAALEPELENVPASNVSLMVEERDAPSPVSESQEKTVTDLPDPEAPAMSDMHTADDKSASGAEMQRKHYAKLTLIFSVTRLVRVSPKTVICSSDAAVVPTQYGCVGISGCCMLVASARAPLC